MALRTKLMLGAMVAATDGECGVVKSLLVDASGPRVAHLMVEPEHRIGLGRFVPVDLISSIGEDAGHGIDLSCGSAHFEALPPAETTEVVPGVPTSYVFFGGRPVPGVEVHQRSLTGEDEESAQATVQATDGPIGTVAGFVTEGADHRIVELLVREERGLWGHKTMAVPISAVASFEGGTHLDLPTAALRQYPAS